MSFFRKIKTELIDIVEYLDNGRNTLAYRFDRHNNEIKNNAKLVVREGQMAVFINEGQLADVFSPGTYNLNTQNLPVLSTLKGWKYGFNSPFKAEVYFINTRNFLNQKWGTKSPVILHDARFGMIELRSFGNFSFKITEPALFFQEVVATNSVVMPSGVTDQLADIIITRFSDAVAELNFPIEQYAAYLNELSSLVSDHVKEDFKCYGIEITKFLIENISMPENVKKEIFEFSRLNKIDLSKYAALKTAKAIDAAASNPEGSPGRGVGLGVGIGLGKTILDVMSQASGQSNKGGNTPPPLPDAEEVFYISLNDQSSGPYNKNGLKLLAKENKFSKSSLVWKSGQESWCEAKDMTELDDVWAETPPPLPR